MTPSNLKIISAGAGSGKTYRLTSEMVALLQSGEVRAKGIIATTFTRKAAAELQERVRVRLLEEGLSEQADDLANALIGTVHSLGGRLLKRFAFEAGVSPEVEPIADEDQQLIFNQSLATVLTNERVQHMEALSNRLGLTKSPFNSTDWRKVVREITDVARANDFDEAVLAKSKKRSFESFQQFLGNPSNQPLEAWNRELKDELAATIDRLDANPDSTGVTANAVKALKVLKSELTLRGELYWHQWVKLCKLKVGAKSRDDYAPMKALAERHEMHPGFQGDIKEFIEQVFDLSVAAIKEYDRYKKQRGMIDYTDMEALILRLLDNEMVQEVLREELDLLMVDEFQDTSPIQLELFYKLAKFAKIAIWVGDPKQSIYGFRGADPALMLEIIKQTGGIQKENIQINSWRSREEVVFATNAIFTKAFNHLPVDQVVLYPKRTKIATADSKNKTNEPDTMGNSLIHWHYTYEGEGRKPGKDWLNSCIATSVAQMLAEGIVIEPRDGSAHRHALAGEIAILCRSNKECEAVADALHNAGIKSAIARTGLLSTIELKLILACLKFILNKYDSLAVAEILLLTNQKNIEGIIEERFEFLEIKEKENLSDADWGRANPVIQHLNELRKRTTELSSEEILNLVLEELDLRRLIAQLGNPAQRLANVDQIRKFALQYEDNCNRLHTAASLGGFLLWLEGLSAEGQDKQGSGEGEDAVNILTYHRSKGLEWPVVICHSLEQKERAGVWGIDLVAEQEEIDLDNILGNRWLRYWVNPYSDQVKGTPLYERLDASPVKNNAVRKARQEEARLMYVGVTRARDYLVFPTRWENTRWLNRVWHEGEESFPTLDADNIETYWEFEGKTLIKQNTITGYDREFPSAPMPEERIEFIEARRGKEPYAPYAFDLSKESLEDHFDLSIDGIEAYTATLLLEEQADVLGVSRAISAFLMAYDANYAKPLQEAIALRILEQLELEELGVDSLIAYAVDFYKKINQISHAEAMHQLPLTAHFDGRSFETKADIVLVDANRATIIQLADSEGEDKQLEKKAKEMGSWFFLAKNAVIERFGVREVDCKVAFLVEGKLVDVLLAASVII